jgi:feruloyl esterase
MMRTPRSHLAIRAALVVTMVLGVGVVTGFAQYVGQLADWKEPATLRPQTTCSSLRSLTTYDFGIDSATLVPAQGDVPEFCHVQGQILPEIRFEVSLPTAWNGRFYMFGNGGFAGERFDNQGRLYRRNNGVQHGFAVAATNTGHDAVREPGASFVQNPQKLIDFAYRSVHMTATTAKSVIRAYYEAPPNKSYFEGCSEGGRQGMILAQRFPDDFDGLALGSGVINFVGNYVDGRNRALAAENISLDNIRLVADELYKQCDGRDGLVDGLIEDPRKCEFSPLEDVRRCQAGKPDKSCLTDEQALAFDKIYTGVRANGSQWYPGLPPASEVFAPTDQGTMRSGWDPWQISGTDPLKSNKRIWGESFFRYMATPGTPVDYLSFDPNRDLDKLRPLASLMNATDPDLSRFKNRGGKILQSWGFAEPALNPLMGIDYYDQVKATIGPSTTDFYRLFMIPGGFHCGGGVGLTHIDTLTPLVNWVERGVAPDRVVGERRVQGKVTRTRPLFPYPQTAKYTGSGSIDAAANFVCTAPDTSPTSSR